MAFSLTGAGGGAIGGAGTGFSIGGPYGAAAGAILGGVLGSGALSGAGGSSSQIPSYNGAQYLPTPQQFAQAQQAQQQNVSDFARQFAQQGTQQNIALQNKVTPGSQAQRGLALNQLNSYIQGQVPMDVQQNTQRAIAQSLGGGYNPFTGGGQAPSAFARNIGQTSLGLSQYGLSAAPTWQQLANSMIVSPLSAGQLGLGAAQLANQQVIGNAQLGMGLAENQYQAGMNQYAQQQLQQQQTANTGLAMGQMGLEAYKASNQANYLGNLSGYTGTSSSPSGGVPSFLSSLFGQGGYTPTQYSTSLGYSAGETPSFGTGA